MDIANTLCCQQVDHKVLDNQIELIEQIDGKVKQIERVGKYEIQKLTYLSAWK